MSYGSTNISIHVIRKSSKKTNAKTSMNGVFVKIASSSIGWTRLFKCDTKRLDREFKALEMVRDVCPGVAARPLVCGVEELHNDESRYLIMEFIPKQYKLYTEPFFEGSVKPDAIRFLGHTLAKIHYMIPLMFGGKEGLLDEELLGFLSTAHYGKLMKDIEQYRAKSCFTNPLTGEQICFSERAAKVLKENPEIVPAISRQFNNFINPPIDTATFAHLDLHFLNIFVDENFFQQNEKNLSQDPTTQSISPIKFCDMEFSNWGPAGADIGLFVGSVAFYVLLHASQVDDDKYDGIADHINTVWDSYKEGIINAAKHSGKSDQSTLRSLYHIAYESVGWTGAWLLRFSLPHLFFSYTINNVYPIGSSLKEYLKSLLSTCKTYDGLEMFRGIVSDFAISALIMGFGDDANNKLNENKMDVYSTTCCDEAILNLVEALHKSKRRLIRQIQTASSTMKKE